MRTDAFMVLLGSLLERAEGCAVRRKAILRQRLFDAVVEGADLQDLLRFLAARDLSAEFTRDAHQLFDLVSGKKLFDKKLFSFRESGKTHYPLGVAEIDATSALAVFAFQTQLHVVAL